MRPRPAAGSPSTAEARAKSVALPASRLTVPGGRDDRAERRVDHRPRGADPHAGEGVDGVAEAGEVEPDVAGDRQAGQLLHGAGGAAGAAEVERAGELRAGLCGHGVAGVGGRRGVPALAGGPGDLEVGGDGEHGHRAAARGDVGDGDGVGPGRGAGRRRPVGGDEQHVLVADLGGRVDDGAGPGIQRGGRRYRGRQPALRAPADARRHDDQRGDGDRGHPQQVRPPLGGRVVGASAGSSRVAPSVKPACAAVRRVRVSSIRLTRVVASTALSSAVGVPLGGAVVPARSAVRSLRGRSRCLRSRSPAARSTPCARSPGP